MIVAGLPLGRSLSVMSRQTKSKIFKSTLDALEKDLNQGTPFSASLKNHPDTFSPLMISMSAAGEESGNLPGALKIVGDQMEKNFLLQKKVKGAMTYPGVIMGIMFIIAILMLTFVVPKLTETFKGFNVELPLSTRLVIGVSDAFQNHIFLVFAGLFIVVVGIVAFLRSAFGKRIVDKVFLKLPVIGTITMEVNSARMARTLSSLLSSGVDVVGAIGITADVVQNSKYKEMLSGLAEKVQKGVPMSGLFLERPDLYPVFVGEMIGVGEETGTLSKVLLDVAIFYETEVDQKTKDLSTIIEPLLMVVIGSAVGFFALAMVTPIYSLSEKI
jgi:type IV pilus assembly protein PilC